MADKKKAVLVLADGSIYYGRGMGRLGTRTGEVVFNTSMTGYQEALTDPSYAGQILLMTYPLVGNYGLNKKWVESDKVWVEGFCVRKDYGMPHHVKSEWNLDAYLEENGVGGIAGLDTRAVVRKIRNSGVMPGALHVYEEEPDIVGLLEKARATDYSELDFVQKVTTNRIVTHGGEGGVQTHGASNRKIALLDCGVKGNIVRELVKRDLQVLVFPAFTKADEMMSYGVKGFVISNGPGDPSRLPAIVGEMKKLMDYPMMGICLGHQLMGWTAGSKTYKLKFGHRGGNHPVMDLKLNKVAITTQNHGFSVDEKGIGKDWEVTHVNLNDNTNEGIAHKSLPIFSVQYHPEAHPGPRDSMYLFDRFVKSL